MKNIIAFDELAFESQGDFKWYLSRGCEIEFIWKGKYYSITHPDGYISIGEGCYLKDGKAYNVLSHTEYNPKDDFYTKSVDDMMDYTIDGDRLGDIVTKIGIVNRTL